MYDAVKRIIINILKNLIRVGKVSSINYQNGTVRVTFPDKDNIVTDELPYLSFEYNMPSINDTVLCVFLGNGIARGFCLGQFYNNNNPPVQPGEQYFYKNIYDEAYFRYDKSSKTLTFCAKNIVLDGETTVTGNLTVNQSLSVSGTISAGGNITSGGSIIDTTGNTNHHSH